MKKQRVTADDGITQIISIDGPSLTIEELRELIPNGWGGYESRIREVESCYRRYLPTPDAPDLEPLTVGWYARRIIARIERLRHVLQHGQAGNLEAVIIEALELGRQITDAEWRLNRGDQTRTGRKVQGGGQKGGRATGLATSTKAQAVDARIRAAHAAYRAKKPDTSQRQMAKDLALRYHWKLETLRGRLRTLNLK